MHFVWMLVVGFAVGVIAKLVMPGRDRGGVVVTILLGIGGSVLAGYIGRAVGWYQGPAEVPGIFASVLGAMLLLFVYRLFTRQTRDKS